MDEGRYRRWRHRFLRFYWIALVVWMVAILLTLTVFGGFGSVVGVINAVITLLIIAVGLGSEYLYRRETGDRT
jgi:hypothetical protein